MVWPRVSLTLFEAIEVEHDHREVGLGRVNLRTQEFASRTIEAAPITKPRKRIRV